ncbi:autoinducer binding domain-containing protein [Mesorhizobium sp. WSM2561]|uniref:autoinducer binding domain-containing protein n=1 Tax=Mesorhizobium sp. WSM2561 TaxID=1040985 RepID=UPI002477E402|nr:autoinducer binding domain-containing protein [Mesorhizobium sp. WSM2561]
MARAAAALDLLTFAYLSLPTRASGKPRLISNYPPRWTAHYLSNGYQTVDPVIARAQCGGCPFRWGLNTAAPVFQNSSSSCSMKRPSSASAAA